MFHPLPPTKAPNAYALARIGVDLFDANAFEHAKNVFRFLLLSRPKEPSLWYWLGRCHQELGDDATAQRLFDLAHRGGVSKLFGPLSRGVCVTRNGRTREVKRHG